MSRSPHSLQRWCAGVLLCATLLVCLSTLLVWQTHFRQQQDHLRDGRFRFSLTQVTASLEAGLRLGFLVADLPGAQPLIDQVRARQTDIVSIDVFDQHGEILFSTDPAGLGSSVPTHWRTPCTQSSAGGWQGQTRDSDVQCQALVNSFGQASGGVLLRYRQLARTAPAVSLPEGWPFMLLGVGVLLAVALWQGCRPIRAAESRAQVLHAAVVDGGPLPPGPPDALWGPTRSGLAMLSAWEQALRDTDTEAERLDNPEADTP